MNQSVFFVAIVALIGGCNFDSARFCGDSGQIGAAVAGASIAGIVFSAVVCSDKQEPDQFRIAEPVPPPLDMAAEPEPDMSAPHDMRPSLDFTSTCSTNSDCTKPHEICKVIPADRGGYYRSCALEYPCAVDSQCPYTCAGNQSDSGCYVCNTAGGYCVHPKCKNDRDCGQGSNGFQARCEVSTGPDDTGCRDGLPPDMTTPSCTIVDSFKEIAPLPAATCAEPVIVQGCVLGCPPAGKVTAHVFPVYSRPVPLQGADPLLWTVVMHGSGYEPKADVGIAPTGSDCDKGRIYRFVSLSYITPQPTPATLQGAYDVDNRLGKGCPSYTQYTIWGDYSRKVYAPGM